MHGVQAACGRCLGGSHTAAHPALRPCSSQLSQLESRLVAGSQAFKPGPPGASAHQEAPTPLPALPSLPNDPSCAPTYRRFLHLDACLYDDPAICNDLYLAPLRADYSPGAVPGRAWLRRITLDLDAPDGGLPMAAARSM